MSDDDDKVYAQCIVCGGTGWIDVHMPCSDHPELVEYYGCCTWCERNTGAQPNAEWAEREWALMNCPEGCLVVIEEVE